MNGEKTNIPKLSRRQNNVYQMLRTGKYSVTEITIHLGYSDPRSYIKSLRDKGIKILDEWVENGEVRFKKYYIKAN